MMKERTYKLFEVLATKWKRDLFFRARIKLTATYTGIAAFILAVFSYLLYNILLARLTESINEHVFDPNVRAHFFEKASAAFQSQILILDSMTLLIVLVFGYILTSITLRPIRKARDREWRFLADAAHELRTPLSVMKSGNEVVLRGETNTSPRLKKLLTENIEEIDSLTRIANGLLSLVNDKEKNANKKSTVPLYQLLSGLIEKLTPIARRKKIKLTLAADESTRKITVYANNNSLTGAFRNIIENAIKYTETDGSVEVVLEKTKTSAVVQVHDTGIGISSDDLSHITEPFFRADAARTATDGSGLGLSIVSETVKAHRGTLNIKSTFGTGTTVRITVPLDSK